MVLCPVALAVGCKRCPVFSVCPAKSMIGDYRAAEEGSATKAKSKPSAQAEKKK